MQTQYIVRRKGKKNREHTLNVVMDPRLCKYPASLFVDGLNESIERTRIFFNLIEQRPVK